MAEATFQTLNITNAAGQIVKHTTGQDDGVLEQYFDGDGNEFMRFFTNEEGGFIQLHDANGNTLEIDARGLMAFVNGQDAPTWQFPVPKVATATA